MKVKVYNQKGEEIGKMELSKEISERKINPDLIHQVVTVLQKNQRLHWAHTKDRGAVRGGGKKPWRQKGTGRARHGSIRSPLWKGGGVTFGPTKSKNLKKKVNKKMAQLALLLLLKDKIAKNNLLIIENLELEKPKTKKLLSLLQHFIPEKKTPASIAVIVQEASQNLKLASRNIKKLSLLDTKNVNPLTLSRHKNIIITKSAFQELVRKTR